MKYWVIHSTDWLLLASDDIDSSVAFGLARTAEVVRSIFVEWFGEELVSARHPVTVMRAAQDYPECFKQVGTVFLTSSAFGNSCAAVFQFAHELCHLMIPSAVPERFKWFEETICRCASVEALRSIASNPRCFTLEQVPHFQRYIDSLLLDKAVIPNGYHLSAYIRENLGAVEKNPIIRRINSAVAEGLVPVLTPAFWQRVPALCDISKDVSFEEGMRWFASALPTEENSRFLALVLGS